MLPNQAVGIQNATHDVPFINMQYTHIYAHFATVDVDVYLKDTAVVL